ncbi:MAG TPA: hypothetical protein VJ623_10160 [Holophagaceae bacterium]|nr:hypothetical protein [Holophagaceae bacterium]
MPRPLAALSLCILPLAAQAPAGAEVRDRIIQEARTSGAAYTKLAVLCDQAGNRLAGSPGLERAIRLTQSMLKTEGLKVWAEPVKVPHWVRGRESASIVKPFPVRLGMLGLGNSVGTPKKGITAQVMVVGSFEELEQRGAKGGDDLGMARHAKVLCSVVIFGILTPRRGPGGKRGPISATGAGSR